MGKDDGSVAPKERINIVYKPHLGDAQEEVELPHRFLVVGDFTGREDERPIEEREPVGVDKDNFEEVLAAHEVNIKLAVPNRLSEGEAGAAEELDVSLDIQSMKDFTPDGLCKQVPELKALVELRDALATLKGPLGNIPGFRKRLQAILDDPEAQKRLLEELGLGEKK